MGNFPYVMSVFWLVIIPLDFVVFSSKKFQQSYHQPYLS